MKILLDTCSLFYVAEKRRLTPELMASVDDAAASRRLFVSLASAWEIGMLASRGKVPMTQNPKDFFENFLRESGATLSDLDVEIMIGSNYLPGKIHGDPMDRLLVETARRNDLTLMTSDRAILAYGAAGHVKTLAC